MEVMGANERWKPIKGHEGYLISDFGRAMNGRNGKLMKPCRTSSGYLYIKCYGKNICIHKAVADAFVRKPEIGGKRLVVHHKDGNKDNNHHSNLMWLNDASHSKIHGISEAVRERQQCKYVGKDANGKITVWNSREEAKSNFNVTDDDFVFACLWDTTITDKHGMVWEINRVLEIQDGKGNTKWKSPRTIEQTKQERRVLDRYIKKQLKK